MTPDKFTTILRKTNFERDCYGAMKRKGQKVVKVTFMKNNLFGRFWTRMAILFSGHKLVDKKIYKKSIAYWVSEKPK